MSTIVRIITGTKAKIAARLCNYGIGVSEPLPGHKTWLDLNVKAVVQGNPNAWVDIIGHASTQWKYTGGTNSHLLNMKLSAARCEELKNIIKGYNQSTKFNIVLAEGDIDANPTKDDGYDRAVELYVYAAPPPPEPEKPKPPTLVNRIVERKFIQTTTENDAQQQPSNPIVDIIFGIASAAAAAASPEGVLEPYELKPPKTAMMPDTHRVNKVVIKEEVAETMSSGAFITVTGTTITYTWGAPRPMVEIVNVNTTAFQGQQLRSDTKSITLSRRFAEDKPFVVPPPP